MLWAWLGWPAREGIPAETAIITVKGERIGLDEWRGHPVLLAFWASDCRSCLEEMPELAALYRDYAGRGLRMAAVAMPYDLPSRVVSMAEGQGWSFPVALDPLGKLTRSLGVELVPNSYLLAGDGTVVLSRVGKPDFPALRETIEKLLQEG